MIESFIAVVATASFAVAGWAFQRVAKVDTLESKVDHLINRVDAIYDKIINDHF